MVKVLVVEDEASIREMIALNLRLAGQAVHKVKTDIVKAAAACEQHGVFCFFEVVNAADAAQLVVVGGLHAEGQPVRAGGKQRL